MLLRKWLVRGLVFAVFGGMGLAALLYQAWTNPVAMRAQVLAKLGERFVGATVAVESARLRLFGGTAVSEVRLARRNSLTNRDLVYVPAAVIYHDKERLLNGSLGLRKIELDRPLIRLVRESDGSCNWQGVLGPVDLRERVPTLVIRRGTLLIEDRTAAAGMPLLEIRELNLTVVNDPLPTLSIEGTGQTDVAGPVKISARFVRATLESATTVELNAVPVGPALVQRLECFQPDVAVHLRHLTGTGVVRAMLACQPSTSRTVCYDISAALHNGAFDHARLPLPLTQIEASAHWINGMVPLAQLAANFVVPEGAAPARLEATVHDLNLPPSSQAVTCPEALARAADWKIEHLPVSADLFGRLSESLQDIKHDYEPAGPVTLSCAFRQDDSGGWTKDWLIQPEGMHGRFHGFRYELERVAGAIAMHTRSDQHNDVTVHLVGYSGERAFALDGEIHGEKSASAVTLDLVADAVPLDGKLFEALPEKSRKIAGQFLSRRSREIGLDRAPMGRADVRAFIRRTRGHREFENRFAITFHDSALQYDQFPLPLEAVTGVLDIRPDHWECRGFRGKHGGGEIQVDGRSYAVAENGAVPAERHDRIAVTVQGREVPLDADFERALAPPEAPGRVALHKAFRMLAPAGRLNFRADVEDCAGRPNELDVTARVRGCALKPAFFRYDLADFAGTVHYARDRVHLTELSARHGSSVLGMRKGEIQLKPGGGFFGRFDGIRGDALRPDAELLVALPPPVRKALEVVHLQAPLDVETDLVVDASAEPGAPSVLWWDGGAQLHNASLKAGVELTGIEGRVFCRGRHDGRHLDGVVGNMLLQQALVLNQPVRNLRGRFEVAPDSPDVLRVRDLAAELFGGQVGGEARLDVSPTPRYEVVLHALGIQLEKLGKHNFGPDVELRGPLQADLSLRGEGTEITDLKGNGRLDVPAGKMLRLPLVIGLLKALGLRQPDRTAFEQAHVEFSIDGPQAQVHKLDLYGNAISLRGRGTLNLDGSDLNLDMNVDWARVGQMLPDSISALPRAVSNQLLKIKLRGKVGDPRFEKELVPGIVEPIKRVLGGDSK